MSLAASVDSDEQLARLLQIGAVLEEVVEARAHRHYRNLPPAERDETIEALLAAATDESAEHRARLEALIRELDAGVPSDQIEDLVSDHYTAPGDFDGVLYDQLNGEETAYKFYDDLIAAIEASDAGFGVDRGELLSTLRELREAEAAGAEEIATLMEERSG